MYNVSGMIPKKKKKPSSQYSTQPWTPGSAPISRTSKPTLSRLGGGSVTSQSKTPSLSYRGQDDSGRVSSRDMNIDPWGGPGTPHQGQPPPPPGHPNAPAPAPAPAPPDADLGPAVPDSTPSDPTQDPEWDGDFPMPPNITPEQWAFLQDYVGYLSGMLERTQSGESFLPEFEYPEFSDFYPEDYYERVVRDPAMARFKETTMPNLQESMGSGFWSTARQKGEQKAMTDLDMMLLSEQAKMESERTKARTGWEQERAKMEMQHMGMEEKARQDYMNNMLGMLGISPFDTVVPGEGGGGLPGLGGGSIWDSLKELFGL